MQEEKSYEDIFLDDLRKVDKDLYSKLVTLINASEEQPFPKPHSIIQDKKSRRAKLVPVSPLGKLENGDFSLDTGFINPQLGLWIEDLDKVPSKIRKLLTDDLGAPQDEIEEGIGFLAELREEAKLAKEQREVITANFPDQLKEILDDLLKVKPKELTENKRTLKVGSLKIVREKRKAHTTKYHDATSLEDAARAIDEAGTRSTKRFEEILNTADDYDVTRMTERLTNIHKLEQPGVNYMKVPGTSNLYINLQAYSEGVKYGAYYISVELDLGDELIEALDDRLQSAPGNTGKRKRERRGKRRRKRNTEPAEEVPEAPPTDEDDDFEDI